MDDQSVYINQLQEDLEAKLEQIEKLEGWLLLLYPAGHHSLDVSDEEEQEIFDYIRELEGK